MQFHIYYTNTYFGLEAMNYSSDMIFNPLFIYSADSEFSSYLHEGMSLLNFKPEILNRIFNDQEQIGMLKKKSRIEDMRFYKNQEEKLFYAEDAEGIDNNEVELEIGRRRMSSKTLFVYFMAEQLQNG